MTTQEAERLLRFINFPSILDLNTYRRLLQESSCHVDVAEDTGRFAPHIDLYRNMITMQLTTTPSRSSGSTQTGCGSSRKDEASSNNSPTPTNSSKEGSWPRPPVDPERRHNTGA